MSEVTIGNLIDEPRSELRIDLDQLVNSRALIQANSGGGKSWLLRLLAEQATGKVQTIILDPEGEFATLREKCDALLVGRGGEAETRLASAQALAQRLCELRVSAIIDLYDLKLPERRRYVRLFLDALMAMPRSAWHPLFIVLDEAQNFAPERAAGEAESLDAVITLMSQGRKRGFAGIVATQRLSKLHKDVAAEANNVIIGRTWLDNDQARAGDLLGLDKRRRMELRDLKPGTWFAFGPALERPGVTHFKAGAVATTHPTAGSRHKLAVPAPSASIKRLLPELAILADENPDVIYDIEAARRRMAELQRQLASRPAVEPTRVEVPVIPREQCDALIHACAAASDGAAIIARGMGDAVQTLRQFEASMAQLVSRMAEAANGVKSTLARFNGKSVAPRAPVLSRAKVAPPTSAAQPAGVMPDGLGRAERCIVRALGQHGPLSKRAVAVITGYAINGGSFNNALSHLRTTGLIDRGDPMQLTQAGQALCPFDPLPTGPDLAAFWMGQLGKAEREILRVLVEAAGSPLTKTEIAERTESRYAPDGGSFGNALSRLRTLGILHGKADGLRIADEML